MNKICTTIEQSNELVKLGLDRITSDMYYYNGNELKIGGSSSQNEELDIPAWSLSALLSLLPSYVSIPAIGEGSYFYELEWHFANDNSLSYAAYLGYDRERKCLIDIYNDHDDDIKDDLDIAFLMVCWVIKNKHLPKWAQKD